MCQPSSGRTLILERDGRVCGLCYEKYPIKQLTVHHIDPTKSLADPANGRTMCLECHPKIHNEDNPITHNSRGEQIFIPPPEPIPTQSKSVIIPFHKLGEFINTILAA